MKRTCLCLLCCALCIGFLGVTACAEYDSIMPTTLEYDVYSNFMIEIPFSINLNDTDSFQIRAYDVDLPNGQELVISIDNEQTAIQENDTLRLTADGAIEKTMECNIYVVDTADQSGTITYSLFDSDFVVAVFDSTNEAPIKYGMLLFTPQRTGAKRGHYTGALYYTVEIKDYL